MPNRKTAHRNIPSLKIKAAYQEAFRMSADSWWRRILNFLFGIKIFNFADAYYREADEQLIQMILDADLGDKEDYETEWYDCDDFAFHLMGIFHTDREAAAMPIFITWVLTPRGAHAVLSYYTHGQVKTIEPQNDSVFPVPADWALTLLCG